MRQSTGKIAEIIRLQMPEQGKSMKECWKLCLNNLLTGKFLKVFIL